jgi:hypothetical protein
MITLASNVVRCHNCCGAFSPKEVVVLGPADHDYCYDCADKKLIEDLYVPKLTVDFAYPPIPLRQFDWCVTDQNYEPGYPIGYGPTIQKALENYLESFCDKFDLFSTKHLKYSWA